MRPKSSVCRMGHEKPSGRECPTCKRARVYARSPLSEESREKARAYNREYMRRLREQERAERATVRCSRMCQRGHLRTPDNVNSSNNCKACKRMRDAERRRRLGKVPRVQLVPSEPDPFGWWQPNRRRSA
jgi:hypothetical protein